MEGIRAGTLCANTLVHGDSRSGKTAAIKLYIKTLACKRRDETSLSPCGDCDSCRKNVGRYADSELTISFPSEPELCQKFDYLPIDCTRITESRLRTELENLWDTDGIRIVYLDELFRLQRRGMDELLLKALEEHNFVWLASSATLEGIEQMFLNRFSAPVRTELPTVDELSEWLALRCQSWMIDWDDPMTLIRLAERCDRVPGKALHVLARAAGTRARRLTERLVSTHEFLTSQTPS